MQFPLDTIVMLVTLVTLVTLDLNHLNTFSLHTASHRHVRWEEKNKHSRSRARSDHSIHTILCAWLSWTS